MDAGAFFQIGQQTRQSCGGGGGHRQHPEIRLQQLRDRHSAAKAAVFQVERAGQILSILQMTNQGLDDLVGKALIVQLVHRQSGVSCPAPHRRRDQQRQRSAAGIGAGGADGLLPQTVCADNGVIGAVRLKQFKGLFRGDTTVISVRHRYGRGHLPPPTVKHQFSSCGSSTESASQRRCQVLCRYLRSHTAP